MGNIESSGASCERGEIRLPDTSELSFVHAVGKELLGKTPIIFAPGLGETAEGTFKKPAEALASLGHDVYALTHPKKAPNVRFLKKEQERAKIRWKKKYGEKLSPETADALFKSIPRTEFQKAYTLIQFIQKEVQKKSGEEKVDVIGHSQGGAYALIAAFLEPELFEHVVLVNPAGQSGQEDPWPLMGRFHTSLFREALRAWTFRQVGDTLVILLRRFPISYVRAIQEGRALATFDAYPFLKALGAIAPEVHKITFFDSDDRIFRAEKIKRAVAIAKGKGTEISLGEWRETKNHGHYSLVTRPEEYAALFHEYFRTSPEKSSEKKAA